MEPLTQLVIALTCISVAVFSLACLEVRKAARMERAYIGLLCNESILHMKLLKETLEKIRKGGEL